MRTCNEIRSLMADWLDGELPANLKTRVDEHLPGCKECRAKFSQMQILGDDLLVLGNAADRMAETAATPARRPRRWHRPWVRAASVAIVVFGGVYFAMVRRPAGHPEVMVEQTRTEERIDVQPTIHETTVVSEGSCQAEGRTAVAMATANPRVRIVWLYDNVETSAGSTSSGGGPKPRPRS